MNPDLDVAQVAAQLKRPRRNLLTERELAEKKRKLEAQTAQLAELKGALEERDKTIEEKDAEIQETKKKLEIAEATIVQLRKAIQETLPADSTAPATAAPAPKATRGRKATEEAPEAPGIDGKPQDPPLSATE